MELADYVTLSEAATLAGVSRRTLQNHMQSGSAPTWERKGREVLFVKAAVVKWKEQRFPAGEPRRGKRRV